MLAYACSYALCAFALHHLRGDGGSSCTCCARTKPDQQHAFGPRGFGLASSFPCSTTMPVRGRYEAPPSSAPGGCGKPFCCSTSSAHADVSAGVTHAQSCSHAHALRAMAKKACSTPLFSFALVPNSAAPMDAAYASDSSCDTCLLRSMSTLLPARTRAMSLPAGPEHQACVSKMRCARCAPAICRSSLTQLFTLVKLSTSVISNTSNAAAQPSAGVSDVGATVRHARRLTQTVRTVCVTIIDGAQRVEALLARGVPDGQVQRGAIDSDTLSEVGGLYRGGLRVREHVCDVAQQQRRLPHATCAAAQRVRGQPGRIAAQRAGLRAAPSPSSTTLNVCDCVGGRDMAAAARGRGAGGRRGSARKRARGKDAAQHASSRSCRQRSKSAPASLPCHHKHAERSAARRTGQAGSGRGRPADVPFAQDALRSAACCGAGRAALRPSATQQMERGYDGACTEPGFSPLRPAHRAHAPATAAGYDRRGDYRRDAGRRDDRDDRDRRPRSSSRDRSPKRSRRESPYRGGRGRDDGQHGAGSACGGERGSFEAQRVHKQWPAPTLTRRCVPSGAYEDHGRGRHGDGGRRR